MRRRKLTPEVIIKSVFTFLLSTAVGFLSFHLTGLVIERRAFADDGVFPKTFSDLPAPAEVTTDKLSDVTPEDVFLKNSYSHPAPISTPEPEVIIEEDQNEFFPDIPSTVEEYDIIDVCPE